MKLKAIIEEKLFRPVWGATLAALCGLLLGLTPLGEPWVNASYDYLFRFGFRHSTNDIVLIQMDNDAYASFRQQRREIWDRKIHTQLLNKLADDGARMVVFDSFFGKRLPDEKADEELAAAMRRQRCLVLMADQAGITHPTLDAAQANTPNEFFLQAATNWGVAYLDPDLDFIVRRHWPFPSPGPYASLPWTAALLAGAHLDDEPRERWLRYYGERGPWTRMSYRIALTQPPGSFRGKTIFIGTQPHTTVPNDGETDEFSTPFTRWRAVSAGGVDIMITSFLNLIHREWLERPPQWLEAVVLLAAGILLGGFFGRLRPMVACAVALGLGFALTVAGILLSYLTNYWFPWLVIAGGQLPFALAWALLMPTIHRVQETITVTSPARAARRVGGKTPAESGEAQPAPEIPDYELVDPPFGEGAYGKVWLAKNAIGQWQALKVIYLANFSDNADPYDREFNGIKKYKPISEQHSGLLRVEFVSQKKPAGYFYYVMELGDPLEPGWEKNPAIYKPRDLASERRRAPGQKLPVRECVRIGLALADALSFLHEQGLTHRDIKPQNVIFVKGQPKLADVGLIAEIRPGDKERTYVGTPGYLPPPPELPGTAQADIYALGMMLYVLSTGRNPTSFPELSTTLVDRTGSAEFISLNALILKACHPDLKRRYATAAEFRLVLKEFEQSLGGKSS